MKLPKDDDHENLMSNVVAFIVEKVLMNIEMTAYLAVSNILEAHNLTFSDCYRYPDVLNFALKEIFDNRHMDVVEKIKIEFARLEDNDHGLSKFIQKLSE